MKKSFITICIPAYKRVDFLKRLLDSIVIQDFLDFEVVLTDDSPGEEVRKLCDQYKEQFKLVYYKNAQALGTPENWNEAMRKATGEWIKLMHDDDWFSHPKSLGMFAETAKINNGHFIFSSYTNLYFDSGKEEKVSPSAFRLKKLIKHPLTILSSNLVGPPSVLIHRNDGKVQYDRNLKWLVDIDFYIRRMEFEKPVHIPHHLVHVGLGEEQVTMMCHLKPEIEIPENFYLLKKTGTHFLGNIMVYDAWWRLFRNLGIRNTVDLGKYTNEPIPEIILQILKDSGKVPLGLLKFGVISKLIMTLSYLKNRGRIR